MECFKKYINALFIITFGFHSSLMVGSEWSYSPFSAFQVMESKSTFSEVISEHPTIVVVSAAALLGSAFLFSVKDEISGVAQQSYKNISEQARKESLNTRSSVEAQMSLRQKAM